MVAWQTVINEVADELVDAMIARGRTEVVSELAKPLPNRLIAMMLGIPKQDHAQFLEWSDAMAEGAFAPLDAHGIALSARSARATAAMRRSLDPLIAQRRRHPGDDLISMMTDSDGDDVLTDDEIFWSAAMLIGAGSETTTNFLSGLFLTLAQQPELYAQLREHPELIPAAIEEQLRFVSPVQGFYRTATRDYTVGANTIPAGARVLLLFAAANRDPRHLRRPGHLRPEPQPVRPPRLRRWHPLLPRHTADPSGSQPGFDATASTGRVHPFRRGLPVSRQPDDARAGASAPRIGAARPGVNGTGATGVAVTTESLESP